jgi:hypothetical protein
MRGRLQRSCGSIYEWRAITRSNGVRPSVSKARIALFRLGFCFIETASTARSGGGTSVFKLRTVKLFSLNIRGMATNHWMNPPKAIMSHSQMSSGAKRMTAGSSNSNEAYKNMKPPGKDNRNTNANVIPVDSKHASSVVAHKLVPMTRTAIVVASQAAFRQFIICLLISKFLPAEWWFRLQLKCFGSVVEKLSSCHQKPNRY